MNQTTESGNTFVPSHVLGSLRGTIDDAEESAVEEADELDVGDDQPETDDSTAHEDDDDENEGNWELTKEERARLERLTEDYSDEAAEALTDLLMPNFDWDALAREHIYREEVERRIGQAELDRTLADDGLGERFIDHVMLSSACGVNAVECARRWLLRSN